MIYLGVFVFISIYLYYVENKKSINFFKQLIVWFPAFFVYVIVPSLQFKVGTDYNTYYNYFFNHEYSLYLDKNEILYYYLMEFVVFIGDPQFQFILISFIQGLLFFYILFLLKNIGFKSWLVFLIFFLVTGMYHNQMNLLRQYVSIYIFIISVIFLYRSEYVKVGLNSILSFFIHGSSIIPSISLFFLKAIKIKNNKILFFIFIFSFLFWSLDYSAIIFNVLEFSGLHYISYIDTQYSEGRSINGILTKFYFLPIILLFWIMYTRTRNESDFFSFIIFIFSLTYFMFLQSTSFDLLMRIWDYFNFFIIFPIYYVLSKLNRFNSFIIFLYILFFYILKVLFFPMAEYEYHLYLGWF